MRVIEGALEIRGRDKWLRQGRGHEGAYLFAPDRRDGHESRRSLAAYSRHVNEQISYSREKPKSLFSHRQAVAQDLRKKQCVTHPGWLTTRPFMRLIARTDSLTDQRAFRRGRLDPSARGPLLS